MTQIDIYLLDTTQHLPILDSYTLDIDTQKASTYTNKNRKKQFLTGRALTRWKISEKLNCSPETLCFKKTEKGKPYIQDTPCHFNLSHSDSFLGLAISSAPIGLDIQVPKKLNHAKLLQRYFHSDILQAYLHTEKAEQESFFLSTWTQAEAHQKTMGESIFNYKKDSSELPKLHIKELQFTASSRLYGAVGSAEPFTHTLTLL